MRMRRLGSSDLHVSEIGLGCNNLGGRIDVPSSRRVVDAALDAGINFFDVADVYGRDRHPGASEEALGEILGGRRRDIVLATKFGLPMNAQGTLKGASRAYIEQAVDASLRRLRTDRIDLYQLHRPDPLTPIDETLRALDGLVRAGKVRAIGCSNTPAWEVVHAEHVARTLGTARFICCQDELSLLSHSAERDLIPAIERFGLGLLPYFPLASGMLTGKYRRGEQPGAETRFANWTALGTATLTERNWALISQFEAVGRAHGHSLIELAFGWLLAKPSVASVIAGATRPEQITANVEAGSTRLSEACLAAIDQVLSQ